ncbi:MAG TPA: T9SS type A sorting domain-containing protein [Puia sp.]|nr:T9SS type A sorting domain-containing protein [Puia sp.]
MSFRITPIRGVVLTLLLTGIQHIGLSQNCRELTATYTVYESRCTATGAVQVRATGGTGTYNYKMQGPSTVDYTSSSYITGLQPGAYTLTVRDITTNCTINIDNIVVPGTYVTPKFGLTETDVTCNNGSDGAISVNAAQNGRQPYLFTIVSPSPMGVGWANSTGNFTGLKPGIYAVQMTDSCGGIQTRTVSIQNYTWSITSATVTLSGCQTYNGKIVLTDSKGNTNASGTAFNGFQYGVVRSPGDTSWYTTSTFSFNIGDARTISLVAKDRCGQVQAKSWSNTVIPSVDANPTFSGQSCTTFNVAVTGQTNLTNPQYCLVDAGGHAVSGEPCNSTGSFSNVPYGSYCIKITNSCYDTVISRCFTQTKSIPAVTATATISNYTCTTFTATVKGQANLINPQYCIVDAAGHTVAGQLCNTSGVFNNLPYGTYKINVKDGCTGTVLPVTVNGAKRTRSVSSTINTSNLGCSTFSAVLTGATNMTNPRYCLVDNLGHEDTCNTTGVFTNIPYGNYCIKVTDGCGDTTITRCINMTKPAPSGGSLSVSNKGCSSYTITVTGQKNIYNGLYCLLDANGNQLACNTTGVFNNVPYGTVCVKTTDGCTNGVFTSCITTTAPVPSVGPVVISNQTCSTYRATVSNQQNLFSPQFCLYDAHGTQVGACNATGVFNVTGYGSYTIKTTDGCTGKVFTSPFTTAKPVASVDATVVFANQTCTSFAVTVTGQTNLAGAQYSLKDNTGTVVATSTSGDFSNVSYGSYCIDITNACRDTTIERCFSLQPTPIGATVTATPSCTYTATDLAIQVTAGTGAYVAKVYDTLYHLLSSASFSGTTASMSGLPSLPAAGKYKVVVSGACGKPDTITVAATPSAVTHSYSITPQCPSSVKANGSGNLVVTATSNLSGLSVAIVGQDGAAVSIGYSFQSGNSFTFSNLDAATYVLAYTFAACTSTVYDTLVMPIYTFPSLSKSSAYQCDNNSFSVGASVSGGIGPYNYEIIASNPSTPSLVTAPQSNPIFSINNNTQYNLIRLRATDACGNAALNDVSVLPLANTIVTATSDCINQGTTLSTEALPNATYSWYKKSKTGDSTLLATGSPTYTIANVRFSDTGLYVAKTSVNAGCLTRIAYFRITGTCGTALPVGVTLEGRQLSGGNQLSWNASNTGITGYELQRSNGINAPYDAIGNVSAQPSGDNYTFMDNDPGQGGHLYRLHIFYNSGGDSYSNTVSLGGKGEPLVSVYPNPVDKLLNIRIQGEPGQRYLVSLYNVIGQCIFARSVDDPSAPILYQRNTSTTKGVYILKVLDTETGAYSTYKLQFK